MSNGGLPRIALVQMEVRAGRPDLNVARIIESIAEARSLEAEIVVFSELCVSGYILGDLWEIDALVRDFASYSDDVRAASDGLTVVFGNVAVDEAHIGEDGRLRKYNAVLVCADGEYVARTGVPAGLADGVHAKTLHPNYRFFDDDRHFYSLRKLAESRGCSPYDWAQPFDIGLRNGDRFRFGVQLCEDMWCQDYDREGEVLDTLRAYTGNGAQAVFNLSSSPWTWQKNDKRNRVVGEILSVSPIPFFYVNNVGAQNNGKNMLVFDGDTTVYTIAGDVERRATPWREEILLTGGDGARGVPISASVVVEAPSETESVYEAILAGLRHMDHIRGGQSRFLVGVSGGIDSSVVACLLRSAFGPQRVFAVNMPTRHNAAITQNNARELCTALGIDYLRCPIEELYERVSALIKGVKFARSDGDYTRLVDENIQARIRFSDILAGIAAKHDLIFTNNGNKTELALGYTTLYGDLAGAIAPIADLYKIQVYELAHYLNDVVFGAEVIPVNLLSREIVPSAELSQEQDVTRGLGDPIKYGYHDAVLRQLIEYRHHPADLMEWYLAGELLDRLEWRGASAEAFAELFADGDSWLADLEWLERQLRISTFKRIQGPPLIVLSKRAFGFDLRETQRPHYTPRHCAALKERIRQTTGK